MSKNFKSVICCVLTLLMVAGTIVFAFADNSNSAAESETASELVSEVVTDVVIEDESSVDEEVSEEESEIAGTIVLLGDVNGDNMITVSDARTVLRIAARLELATAEQSIIADINGSGTITASDARAILRVAARLDPMFGTIII